MKTYEQQIAEAVRDAIVERLSGEHNWLTNVAASALVLNTNLDAIIAKHTGGK